MRTFVILSIFAILVATVFGSEDQIQSELLRRVRRQFGGGIGQLGQALGAGFEAGVEAAEEVLEEGAYGGQGFGNQGFGQGGSYGVQPGYGGGFNQGYGGYQR
ncbi:acanthoscurrin-1-like [Episyrphus balteatus]|uniref:acanthoscurrin-1-like n=1 Tax=Episyrphus balteatus TaxID=286459 RepID=UPI002486C5D5|nr:acanthoscurrin-1-like [Episyrphus balteatus]